MADNDKNGTRENNDVSGDSAEGHDSPEEMNSQEGDNDEETPRRKQVPQSDKSRTSQDSSGTTKAKSTAEKERKRRKQVPQSDKSSASQDPSRTTKAKLTAEKMQKSDDKQRHTYTLWYLGSIVLVTVLAIAVGRAAALYMYPSDYDVSERANPNFAKIYELGLQRLEGSFKNQTPRFWKTLRNRGLAHLKRVQPTQPLVLMLVAPPSAHTWVNCFVKKLAKILDLEHENGLSVINGKDYISSVGDKAKEDLDNKLKETLQSGHRAAVVCDLQLLPPPSPVLFHSYCDNDNAPYKHVAILFTVCVKGG